ncbi:RNA14 [Candida oxycetoniae]|uniref:mRNA 3'-end-processing protein RNA14 n=1 Tax=Candida oxycetoniae TaxID=497107 RepID=A0AAI9SWZ0_9ASCO|nr:RNA14 [Candida oxycetoniae]KAI3404404.2 RNA14 [Candida oxycetoniae]
MSTQVFIPKSKVKKLSLDKITQLEEDLEENPLDYGKWIKLLDQILNKDNQEQVRRTFDKYLERFKFDGAQWIRYIKYELSRGEKEKAETLFQKCFATTESVELCRLYVDYVRSISDFVTGGDKARTTVVQAFEFAINKVGIDFRSDELWQDYINFIKSWTPQANWEQQQKIDLIRKVYKKFLVVPTENIESVWTQYTKWENELNSATAQKFVSEKAAEFMLARSFNTEWRQVTNNKKLKWTINSQTIKDESVQQQAKYWANWIQLEKKNPLELKDESALQSRVNYVYKQATYALPFVPQLWFEYVKYLLNNNEEGNLGDCISILKSGLTINPQSLLLSFQLAELYEKDNSFDKAKVIFNNLISNLTKDFEKVSTNLKELNERLKPKSQSGEDDGSDNSDNDDGKGNRNGEDNDNSEKGGEMMKEASTNNGQSNGRGIASLPSLPKLGKNMTINSSSGTNTSAPASLPSLPKIPNQQSNGVSMADLRQLQMLERKQKRLIDKITLIYSKLMIASKRAEGIKEARNVFKNARKLPSIGYQIFIESALLEHYADNIKTAIKVFDVGLKSSATNGEFLSKYLDYLIMINDVDRLRSTIQNADTNFSKELSQLKEGIKEEELDPLLKKEKEKKLRLKKRQLKGLYKKYISFAATNLSLDITNSFAKKCEQLFPDDDPVDLFTDRYKLGKLNIIKADELNEDAYDFEDEDEDDFPSLKRRRIAASSIGAEESRLAVTSIQESSRIEQETAEQERDAKADSSTAFVGPSILTLMTVLPNASYFGLPSENVFNSEKLVTLFANLPNIS